MKIVKQTTQTLVLREIHLAIGLILFGLTFTLAALFMLYILAYNVGVMTLQCERIEPTQVNCEVKTTKLFGFLTLEIQQLSHVTEAQYNRREGRDSEGGRLVDNEVLITQRHDPVFVLQLDSMYVNGVKGNPDKMRTLAAELDAFLASTELDWHSSFSNWHSGHLLFMLFISIFLLIGGSILIHNLLVAGTEKLSFDRIKGQFTYQKTSILNREKTVQPLTEIEKLLIEVRSDDDGDVKLRLKLCTKQPREYLLLHTMSEKVLEKRVNPIKTFLQCDIERVSET